MKILIVNKFLYPNGGSETYIFRIGDMLRQMGHEVQYFGMEHEGRVVGNHADSYTSSMDFHSEGINKLTYPFRIIYSVESRKKIRNVLEDFHPDVVHLNNINFQITPSVIDEITAFDSTIRIVSTAHDYQWICPNHMLRIPSTGELCQKCTQGNYSYCWKNRCIHNSSLQSLLGTMEGRFYRRRGTYRKVSDIICPSRFLASMLSFHPDLKGRCIPLHNFIENDAETSPVTQVSEMRWPLSAIPDRYVLFFGRFDEEKGMKTLLTAMRKLPDVPFVFAGKGAYEDKINATENGFNLGFLKNEQLRVVIEHAAFSVYPSVWYENCPFSVIESQLYGTPVLVSDLGGSPELIQVHITGETFKAGNADDLTARIRGLWNDDSRLEEYRRACLEHTRDRFDSLEVYCGKLLRIYRGEYSGERI
jgi:glycosyltransferase involved in cell wall biosynthesis